ncbi:MAG: hypothetical protein WCP97_00020 [bacterium]
MTKERKTLLLLMGIVFGFCFIVIVLLSVLREWYGLKTNAKFSDISVQKIETSLIQVSLYDANGLGISKKILNLSGVEVVSAVDQFEYYGQQKSLFVLKKSGALSKNKRELFFIEEYKDGVLVQLPNPSGQQALRFMQLSSDGRFLLSSFESEVDGTVDGYIFDRVERKWSGPLLATLLPTSVQRYAEEARQSQFIDDPSYSWWNSTTIGWDSESGQVLLVDPTVFDFDSNGNLQNRFDYSLLAYDVVAGKPIDSTGRQFLFYKSYSTESNYVVDKEGRFIVRSQQPFFGEATISLYDTKTNKSEVLVSWSNFFDGDSVFFDPIGQSGKVLVNLSYGKGCYILDTGTKQLAPFVEPSVGNAATVCEVLVL